MYRVCVFVPVGHVEQVRRGVLAVHSPGSEHYDQVLWISDAVHEHFRPLPGAHPAQGAVGTTSVVPSVRLEFALPRDPQLLARVIEQGILPHHPWEQPGLFVDETFHPRP